MGPPPALSEPPPAEGGDMFGGMDMGAPPPAMPSDDLPTFGDMGGAPPAMPDMGGGGMMPPMGGGMPAMDASFAAPAEMGPVAEWRIEQQERVSAKAEAAAAAEAAKVAEAQAALAEFYAERKAKSSARAKSNREEEKQFIQDRDAAMIADSWDSVCKLVDLKEKANAEVDTSRIRSLLIQLKN